MDNNFNNGMNNNPNNNYDPNNNYGQNNFQQNGQPNGYNQNGQPGGYQNGYGQNGYNQNGYNQNGQPGGYQNGFNQNSQPGGYQNGYNQNGYNQNSQPNGYQNYNNTQMNQGMNNNSNYNPNNNSGNTPNNNNNKKENKKKTKKLVVIFILLFVLLAGIITWIVLASGKKQVKPIATPTPEPVAEETKEPEATPTESPTPSPEPTAAPTDIPLNGYKIAIDPGHQAKGDSSTEPMGPGSSTKKAKVSDGATGISTGVAESELNLTIAKKLRKILKKRGYEVYMTRTTQDVNISNAERARAANSSGADICIRIHADGVEDKSTRGVSVLYPGDDNEFVSYLSDDSKRLANAILNSYSTKTGFANRGIVSRDDMTGFNWSEIPVALIELGFLSNAAEDEQMQVSGFQKMMATGIADGIDDYFGL